MKVSIVQTNAVTFHTPCSHFTSTRTMLTFPITTYDAFGRDLILHSIDTILVHFIFFYFNSFLERKKRYHIIVETFFHNLYRKLKRGINAASLKNTKF